MKYEGSWNNYSTGSICRLKDRNFRINEFLIIVDPIKGFNWRGSRSKGL